jgi:hypothetical protein
MVRNPFFTLYEQDHFEDLRYDYGHAQSNGYALNVDIHNASLFGLV